MLLNHVNVVRNSIYLTYMYRLRLTYVWKCSTLTHTFLTPNIVLILDQYIQVMLPWSPEDEVCVRRIHDGKYGGTCTRLSMSHRQVMLSQQKVCICIRLERHPTNSQTDEILGVTGFIARSPRFARSFDWNTTDCFTRVVLSNRRCVLGCICMNPILVE